MRPLDSLNVEVAKSCAAKILWGQRCMLKQTITIPTILFSDRGVSAIGQRARAADAEAGDVVRVLAEGALGRDLRLERAEAVVDDLPHHLVVLHCY